MIAAEFKETLSTKKEELGIEKIENVGGYCNIFMDEARAWFIKMEQNDS